MTDIPESSSNEHSYVCNQSVSFGKPDDSCIWLKHVSTVPSTNRSIYSPANSSGPICRICHEGDGKEELAAPCLCSGSMGLIHISCLEIWLSSSDSDTCEICNFKFVIYRQPKPFTEWILRPSSPEECRNLVGDLLCFALLTPLATVSSYLCFSGAKHYASWSTKWEASGLICLSIMLITIYMTWCFVTTRFHLRNWQSWRTTHQNVFIVRMRKVSTDLPIRTLNMQDNNNNNDDDDRLRQLYNFHDTSAACGQGNVSNRSHVLSISRIFGNTSAISSTGFRPNAPRFIVGDGSATPRLSCPIQAAMVEMVSFEIDQSESTLADQSNGELCRSGSNGNDIPRFL